MTFSFHGCVNRTLISLYSLSVPCTLHIRSLSPRGLALNNYLFIATFHPHFHTLPHTSTHTRNRELRTGSEVEHPETTRAYKSNLIGKRGTDHSLRGFGLRKTEEGVEVVVGSMCDVSWGSLHTCYDKGLHLLESQLFPSPFYHPEIGK